MIEREGRLKTAENSQIIYDLNSRVYLLSEFTNVVHFIQVPFPSMVSSQYMLSKLNEFCQQFEFVILLADYTENKKRESSEIRALANSYLLNLNIKHISFITGKNKILNAAISIAIKKTGIKSFSLHKNYAEAINLMPSLIKNFE